MVGTLLQQQYARGWMCGCQAETIERDKREPASLHERKTIEYRPGPRAYMHIFVSVVVVALTLQLNLYGIFTLSDVLDKAMVTDMLRSTTTPR